MEDEILLSETCFSAASICRNARAWSIRQKLGLNYRSVRISDWIYTAVSLLCRAIYEA